MLTLFLGKGKLDHGYGYFNGLIPLKPLFSNMFYPTKSNFYNPLYVLIYSSYTLQTSLNDSLSNKFTLIPFIYNIIIIVSMLTSINFTDNVNLFSKKSDFANTTKEAMCSNVIS